MASLAVSLRALLFLPVLLGTLITAEANLRRGKVTDVVAASADGDGDGKGVTWEKKRGDDISIASLQTLVEQQAATIQSLQASQQSLQNRLTALENRNSALEGKVTTLQSSAAVQARTVAFTVRFKADDGANGLPLGPHSTLRFDDVLVNAGSGYDPHTGFFTAPVAGVYSFFLTHMGAGAQGESYLEIVKHGQVVDLVYSKDHEDQGSSQVMVHLGAGEQLWVQNYHGSSVRGGWWTVFSGFLVRAD